MKVRALVLSLFIIFLLGIAFFPSLLSSNFGSRFALGLINQRIEGKVEAEKLSIGWFSPLHLQSGSYQNPGKGISVSAEEIQSDLTFLPLILKRIPSTFALKGGDAAFVDLDSRKKTSLKQLEASMTLSADDDFRVISLNGLSESSQRPGSFQVEFTLPTEKIMRQLQSGTFSEKDFPSIQMTVKDFPTKILDHLLGRAESGNKKSFEELLGSLVSVSVQTHDKGNEAILTGRLQSEALQGSLTGRFDSEQFTLDDSSQLLWSPAFIEPSDQPAKLTIEKLSIPYVNSWNQTQFLCALDSSPIATHFWSEIQSSTSRFEKAPGHKKISIHSVTEVQDETHFYKSKAEINPTQSEMPFTFEVVGKVPLPLLNEEIDLMVTGSGDVTQLSVDVNAKNEATNGHLEGSARMIRLDKKAPVVESLKANWKSPNGEMDLQAANRFALSTVVPLRGSLTLNMNPDLYRQIVSPFLPGTFLKDSSTVHVELSRCMIPMDLNRFESLEVEGTLSSNHLHIQDRENQSLLNLAGLQSNLFFSGPDHEARLSIGGKVQDNSSQQSGVLNIQLSSQHLNGFDLPDEFEFKGKVDRFPTALLGFDEGDLLSILMGPNIQANWSGAFQKGSSSPLELSLNSEDLNLKGNLEMGQLLHSPNENDPIRIDWTMRPHDFDRLMSRNETPLKSSKLRLQKPVDVHMELKHLTLPWMEVKDDSWNLAPLWGLNHISGQLSVSAKEVVIENPATREITTLNTIEGNSSIKDLSKQVEFSFKSNGILKNRDVKEIQILLSGNLKDLLNQDLSLRSKDLSLNMSLYTTQAPIELIGSILGQSPAIAKQTSALIGSYVDTELSVHFQQMKGPLLLRLHGNRGAISLKGNLSNGYLTLDDPFIAEIEPSAELGSSVLESVFPLLSSIQGGSEPIHIYIDPQNFQFPLQNFSVDKIRIDQSRLGLGTLHFSREGQVANLLKMLSGQPPKGQIEVQFTPLYASMREGNLHVARMDFLAMQTYPFAIWGDANFKTDQLKMTLGITPLALEKAMNMTSLPADYMMQIPIRGTPSDATVDFAKASTKIGALIAKIQGSKEGMIISGVLDLLGGKLKEPNAPKPTTEPLPWKTASSEGKLQDRKSITVDLIENEAKKILNVFK